MKIFINSIAVFALTMQAVYVLLSGLSLKKPEGIMDSIYNYYVLAALVCSLLSLVIFIILYNYSSLPLKKWHLCILGIIILLGAHVYIFEFSKETYISCISLTCDLYVIYKILKIQFCNPPEAGKSPKTGIQERFRRV